MVADVTEATVRRAYTHRTLAGSEDLVNAERLIPSTL